MGNHGPNLYEQVNRLRQRQLREWPLLAENTAALHNDVICRSLGLRHREFSIQHNPARVVSTAARVDAASLAQRPCFLCAANRPDRQEGIEVGNYEILFNPYPIFPGHLTVVSRRHEPQRIARHIDEMIDMAVRLVPLTLFYNGPECGASAPDHLHFQAARSECFQIWDVVHSKAFMPVASRAGVDLYDCDPAFFHISGSAGDVVTIFRKLLLRLPHDVKSPEPRINVLVESSGGNQIEMIVIPRSRHRPDCYGTAPSQMLVSPGTIDMAGTVVLPRREDFDTIDAARLQSVIDSVGIPYADLLKIFETL